MNDVHPSRTSAGKVLATFSGRCSTVAKLGQAPAPGTPA
jgi:hypothetical protein